MRGSLTAVRHLLSVPVLGLAGVLTACGGHSSGSSTTSTVALTYSIGGSIAGLSGTVVLQNNGSDNLSLSSNGSFALRFTLQPNSPYDVTVRHAAGRSGLHGHQRQRNGQGLGHQCQRRVQFELECHRCMDLGYGLPFRERPRCLWHTGHSRGEQYARRAPTADRMDRCRRQFLAVRRQQCGQCRHAQ